ncbi:MAG: hypothetical protein KKF44_07700, partial [Nanoarchaeota archaeon]|nr:hypothetical protein [Nanoarchaeota archaeon]
GNALMSSPCLNNGMKGIILQSKIDSLDSCFDYPAGEIEITTESFSRTVLLGSEPFMDDKAVFDVLVELGNGQKVPGELVVRL